MSRSGEITLAWGDHDHTFRLGIAEWEKVQEKCDAGPSEILSRIAPVFAATEAGLDVKQLITAGYLGTWRINDVREPLYRGLIGGGLEPTAAGRVIRELVDERPLMESVCMAYRVVLASVVGAEDEPIGDDAPGESVGEGGATASPAGSSPSPTITAPAPSSASRRVRSANSPSGSSSPPPKVGAPPTAPRKGHGLRPMKSMTP